MVNSLTPEEQIQENEVQKTVTMTATGTPQGAVLTVASLLPPTAVLIRSNLSTKETMGRLTATDDGKVFSCDTLELPWLDNEPNVSCIPTGTYHCTLQPFHATEMYQLSDVSGRFAIFIHNGNFATGNKVDTEGCILLGSSFSDIDGNGQQDVINSDNTVKAFIEFFNGKPFTLTVK